MRLKKGKLYRVKAIHPSKVAEPFDMSYYPADIDADGKVFWNFRGPNGKSQSRYLEVGDIFLYLGNLNGSFTHTQLFEYSIILLGEKVLASNATIEDMHAYYEMELVGHGV